MDYMYWITNISSYLKTHWCMEMTTLQEKIYLDIQLVMDNEYINEIYDKYGISLVELRTKLLDMIKEHIQELREEIRQYAFGIFQGEPTDDDLSISLADLFRLIGEKK